MYDSVDNKTYIQPETNHDKEHNHSQAHGHDHEHGKMPIVFYFIGLILAIVALILPTETAGNIKNILFIISTILAGYHVAILEGFGHTLKELFLHQRFRPDSHLLMGLAALGAIILGEYWEGALLILIFGGAHFLENYAEGRSQREITKLLDLNPTSARRYKPDGSIEIVDVDYLRIDDRVQVLNGDQVPIDGVVLEGQTTINEASISGESMPQDKKPGDQVYGSTINGSGTIIIEVTKESKDTVFGRIMSLVEENQGNRTRATTVIEKYEPYYVTFVLLGVIVFILLMPVLTNMTLETSFYRGLLILVSASPCALAAATVSATLSATSSFARQGVLSRGTVFIQELAKIDAIAFDKTGTLTLGKPQVTNTYFTEDIEQAAWINLLVSMEKQANHPLAKAIVDYFGEENGDIDLSVENQAGKGVATEYKGTRYRIGKPSSYNNISPEIVEITEDWESKGNTVIYASSAEEVKVVIALMDIPQTAAIKAIEYFKSQDIETHMISGDAQLTGQAIGAQLKIDHVSANVLPDEKSNIIAELQAQGKSVAFVGDGVNDAPALVKSNVGIAMGDGTDVALEVADLALMQNNLSNLVYAHKKARKMNRVVWQNIVFSLAVVVILVIMALTGFSNMTLSVIFHEGSTIVVILNGLRLLLK